MKLIGIGHRKRSGKDLSGQYFVETYGCNRVAFADPLKRAAMAIFGFTHEQCYGTDLQKETIDPRWGFSPRTAMQRLGEEARNVFGPDVWIKSAEATITTQYVSTDVRHRDSGKRPGVVVTDLRYPNEAAMIRRLGGITVRIDRPSLGPLTDTHPSETSLLDFEFDHIIMNDATIEDLYRKLDALWLEYGTAS